MTAQTESLRQLLGGLHAERVRTWDPAILQVSIDQRKTLVRDSDYAGFVKTGDRLDSFTLTEVDRGPLDIDTLLKAGPVVLVFFRFATCPACNIALPYYNRQLAPRLASLGATLIAVSPQDPRPAQGHQGPPGARFLVASDGNALSRRLGILYTFDEASRPPPWPREPSSATSPARAPGNCRCPTVVVIGQDRVVRFADVSPDWMVRTEAEPVIAAVEALESVPGVAAPAARPAEPFSLNPGQR